MPFGPNQGQAHPLDLLSDDEIMALTDEQLGIDPLQLDSSPAQSYHGNPILEGLGGLESQNFGHPGNFLEGLVSGGLQGIGRAGTRAQQEHAKFEAASLQRQAKKDEGNREATAAYRKRRMDAQKDVKSTRASEKKDRDKYNRETVRPTPDDLKAAPWLARMLDENGRVPSSVAAQAYKPDKQDKPGDFTDNMTMQQRLDYEKRLAQVRAEGANIPGTKPPNAEQGRAATFYSRANNAVNAAVGGGLEDAIARNNQALYGLNAPNELQNKEQQAYKQAINDFGLAFLRKESGATILPSEFEYVQKTFFAYPGDKQGTLERKRRSRAEILSGLQREGQPAIDYAGQSAPPPAPALPVPPTWKRVQ